MTRHVLKSFAAVAGAAQDRVIYASLTSALQLDSGSLQNSGTEEYDTAKGMRPNGATGTSPYIVWSGLDAASLNSGYHLHFEIEKESLSYSYSGTNRHSTWSGPAKFVWTGTGLSDQALGGAANQLEALLNHVQRPTEETHTAWDVIDDGVTQWTYVDSCLVRSAATIPISTALSNLNAFYLFASQIGSESFIAPFFTKNLFLYTQPQVRPYQELNINTFGDSLFQLGNYGTSWENTTGVAGSFDLRDMGVVPQIEKALNGYGYATTIVSNAVGGEKMSQLSAQIAASPDLTGQVAMVYMGTNDYSSGTLSTNFEQDLNNSLASLLAKNPSFVIVSTITTLKYNSVTNTPDVVAATDQGNAIIKSVVSASDGVYLLDMFTIFGGENAAQSLFEGDGTNNLHWSAQGNMLAGNSWSEVAVNPTPSAGDNGTRTGKSGIIQIGGDGLLQAKSWTIENSAEPIDASVIGDDWKNAKAGLNGYTFSIEGYYDVEDIGQEQLNIGSLIDFDLWPAGPENGQKHYSGTGYVTAYTDTASYDGMVEFSCTVVGNNSLTQVEQLNAPLTFSVGSVESPNEPGLRWGASPNLHVDPANGWGTIDPADYNGFVIGNINEVADSNFGPGFSILLMGKGLPQGLIKSVLINGVTYDTSMNDFRFGEAGSETPSLKTYTFWAWDRRTTILEDQAGGSDVTVTVTPE